MKTVFLQPGGWFFSDQPTRVSTILGSCLGIVMRGGGAACVAHCVLPHWDGEPSHAPPGTYVDRALPKMFRAFEERGLRRVDLEVKLFGGAGVLFQGGSRPAQSVGRQNLEAALDILLREGIRVAARQVGGDLGRKIEIDTESGDVFVRVLRRIDALTGPLASL